MDLEVRVEALGMPCPMMSFSERLLPAAPVEVPLPRDHQVLEHRVALQTKTQWTANPRGLLHWRLCLSVVDVVVALPEVASREHGIRLGQECACQSQKRLWLDILGNPMSRFPRADTGIAL